MRRQEARSSMKCWTFLVLQLLTSAAEVTSATPRQKSPCEVPMLRNSLIVEEKTDRWGKTTYPQVPPGTPLLEKNNLFLKCKKGYEYNGRSLTRISCRDGHWDLPQPWCKEKPCRELPVVKNAQVVIGPVPHGQELEYLCFPGYRLMSSGTTPKCRLGQVVGTLPKCHQTFCSETGFPKEAVHLILQKPVFYDGEYLDYNCGPDFVSTHSRVKCTDGRWIPEDEQPFCKAKNCRLEEIPEIQNGFLEGTPNISHTSVIRFRCNEGYTFDGQQSMRCSYGKWEGQRPSCVRHKAPPHPDVGAQRGGGHDTNTYRAGEDPHEVGISAKGPQLRSCKFPEREIRLYAADGNVRVLPNDNVTHSTVLRFHCRPLGELRFGGSGSSRCNNGTWSDEVPYCYEPGIYDVVIRLKDTAGTAVSPDGYLNIDPRFEVEIECESYYYTPRLELIEPVSTWKMGDVRSILKKLHWKNHYVSSKFILPEDYQGIVRCSNDPKYPSQIIKVRSRYLHSCKIPVQSDATVVTRVNKEMVAVACKPPYVLRGEARAVCLAHSEWEKPFPKCVLPAHTNISNEYGNVNMQSAKPDLEQTTEIPRPKAPPHPDVGAQRGGGHDTNTYGAGEDPHEIGSSAKGPQLRSCKFPEREIRFYAADGNVRVLPNDNVTHGTVLRFHCRPLGEMMLVGNVSSQCINGTWSSEVPNCYEPGRYDVVIRLKDTGGTAVSPDGYLNIDPRFEVEMECESYYYTPRLEMIEPVSTWKMGDVRSILKKLPWKNHYVSSKFILPEDYQGILRCSNDHKYPSQIIKVRSRYLHSCKIPAHFDATVVTRVNEEIVKVACKPPYVLRGEARAVCLAHSEWEKPFPECVLPAPTNMSNKPGNVNMQSAKPDLERTIEIPRLKATQAPGCDVSDFFTAAPYLVVINASASEVALGAVFEAFCDDEGYILEGRSRVTCKANGMWDFDAKMTCVKGCPNFADQDERLIIDGILPTYRLGNSITLSCPRGTKLNPHVERMICLGDGWSETELPHCLDTEQEQKSRVSDDRKSAYQRASSPALPSF